MVSTSRSRGFTLIELLVVIAIIGILSAVILASLSTARGKGEDAAVQSDLHSIQVEAEIYADTNGSYSNASGLGFSHCATLSGTMLSDTSIQNAVNGAISAEGGSASNLICG